MFTKINGSAWALALVCGTVFGVVSACDPRGRDPGTGGAAGSSNGEGCPDDLEFFQARVFTPILGQKCVVCHAEGGLAGESALVLDPAGSEAAGKANFETVRDVARTEVDGKSILLLRPTGLHPDGHPGGDLIDLGSSEYAALSAFVDRVAKGKCDSGVLACDGPSRGGRMLRRLSRSEYDATIGDLFGFPSAWGAAFTPDTVVNGFANNASALVVSPLLADQVRRAAEEIADTAFLAPAGLVPCDPASGNAACAEAFITSFGKRAFRRPLDDADRARYLALYTTVAAEDGFLEGAKTIVTAMLQSPHFLYRSELGGAAKNGLVSLTPHEIASELSYLFWGTMPDPELFAAADTGKLATAAELEKQAERLLADPRSDAVLDRFVDEWLLVGNIVNVPKDEALFPGFTPTIRAAMREETRVAFRKVLRGADPTLPALLVSDRTFVSPDLAAFYGESGGAPDPDGLIEIDLSATERRGLLTQGSVLATHARPTDSSPIHRGQLIRTRIFCQDLPPPPAGFNVQPPALDPSLTTRERYLAHSTEEPCKSCHKLMDPIGFGFERFDGVGRFRSTENGKVIDASGEIVSTASTNGSFDGTKDLMSTLAASPDTGACFSLQWLRFAYGIEEGPETQCLAEQVAEDFAAGSLRIDTLLVNLARTSHFTERTADSDVDDNPDPGNTTGTGGSGAGATGGAGQGGAAGGDPGVEELAVTVKQDNQWATGYCSTVTVENTGSSTVTWEISLAVDGMITDLWNAKSAPDGAKLQFTGIDYNAVLDGGESTSFGFCATL